MLTEARELVSERLGLAFPSRRGDDLQQAFAARSVASLREQPTTGPEWRSLISELTVRESYFFRESGELEQALSALIAERRDTRRLALWSAGCASGEEPYTLAMLLAALLPEPWDITIYATDVDTAALEAGRRGIYSDWGLRKTPAWARRMYFRPVGQRRFELSRQIREAVTFAPLNLATDGYPGSLDLIVCRNVLMYFTDAARERTVERLNASLAPGGRLALSPLDAPQALGSPPPAPPAAREPEPRPAPAPAPRVDTLVKARAEADGGRLEAARALCLETLRERPLDADAHLLLAAVEEERGDLDASIWALRRAIYTAPDGPAAHFRLGGLLLRTGAAEAGRRSFATAAALLADADPGTLVDGVTAGEVLAAARGAS
jgi:chemotaxis protein methyltransferase CheR